MKNFCEEKGVAIILALIMLLIMSVMALTVSFISNIDFTSMSVFRRGQESFLAAETCVSIGRERLETIGIETLYFLLQDVSSQGIQSPDSPLVIVAPLDPSDDPTDSPSEWKGPMCRAGSRIWDGTNGYAPFVHPPPSAKVTGRPLKNTSLPSGGLGGASLVPNSFIVVGKDSQDKDKDDTDNTINTGIEIAVGFETFIPGGATNVY